MFISPGAFMAGGHDLTRQQLEQTTGAAIPDWMRRLYGPLADFFFD